MSVVATKINELARESTLLADLENALEHDRRLLSADKVAAMQAQATVQRELVSEARKALVLAVTQAFASRPSPPTGERTGPPSIPNYNTLSTLIDRISIENVKLVHFEQRAAQDPGMDQKARVQRAMLVRLLSELDERLTDILRDGTYTYMKEERTFA